MTSSVAGGGTDNVFIRVISYSIYRAFMTAIAPENVHGVCFSIHFPNSGSVICTTRNEYIRFSFVRTPTNIPNNISFNKYRKMKLLMCSTFSNLGTRFDISKKKTICLDQTISICVQ